MGGKPHQPAPEPKIEAPPPEPKSAESEQGGVVETAEEAHDGVSAFREAPQVYYDRGETFYYGREVAKDYAKAAEWYRKAAEQGDAVAQIKLKNKGLKW